VIRSLLGNLVRRLAAPALLADVDSESRATIKRVRPFTLTSPERIFSLIHAVRHVVGAGIPGAFVECGVWRGGSMMAAALTLLELGKQDVDLYLFDTYDGMTAPSAADVDLSGLAASGRYTRTKTNSGSTWCRASLEDVQANLAGTRYDPGKIHFVRGMVEATIPAEAPASISILRLDTDWYESTRHELEHLFPRLVPGGVLIIDDYGHWQGSRRATDEYFAAHGISMLLNRVDYSGRVGINTR
jgi:O-methyltransferase